MVKIKKKLTFKCRVTFESQGLRFINMFLCDLKKYKFLSKDNHTNLNNTPGTLLKFDGNNESMNVLLNYTDQQMHIILEDEHYSVIDQDAPMISSNKTAAIAEIPCESDLEGTVSLALEEGKVPILLVNYKLCKEL